MKRRRIVRHEKPTLKKLLALFIVFFRIGLFTFGGGYAMLPLIQKEIIEKKKWISEIELMDILVIAESTPGPVSVNTATYVGYHIAGFWGSLFSTLALALPSFVIIYIISLFFDDFLKIKWVQYAFLGIQAAVAVLIISAAEKLFHKMKKSFFAVLLCLLTAGITIAIKKLNIDFSSVFMIVLGGSIAASSAAISLEKESETQKAKLTEIDSIGSLK